MANNPHPYPENPWDHPDWYDLHDREWTAGSEREPEHYHELLIALPPLDSEDHVVDIGAGTGKLSALVSTGYPRLGLLTLVEPNKDKLERARLRLREILGADRVRTSPELLGKGRPPGLAKPATVAVVGSVFMPILEGWKETPASAIEWLNKALIETRELLIPGGWVYLLETTARFWIPGTRVENGRLTSTELQTQLELAGLRSVDCVYRFRDRVILRAQRP